MEMSVHVVGTSQRGHVTDPEFPPTPVETAMILTFVPWGHRDSHSWSYPASIGPKWVNIFYSVPSYSAWGFFGLNVLSSHLWGFCLGLLLVIFFYCKYHDHSFQYKKCFCWVCYFCCLKSAQLNLNKRIKVSPSRLLFSCIYRLAKCTLFICVSLCMSIQTYVLLHKSPDNSPIINWSISSWEHSVISSNFFFFFLGEIEKT